MSEQKPSYMQDVDAWLTTVVFTTEPGETPDLWLSRAKRQTKDKLLESYRNGQVAGPRTTRPSAETRRPFPRRGA
jgi:hypothetical protein